MHVLKFYQGGFPPLISSLLRHVKWLRLLEEELWIGEKSKWWWIHHVVVLKYQHYLLFNLTNIHWAPESAGYGTGCGTMLPVGSSLVDPKYIKRGKNSCWEVHGKLVHCELGSGHSLIWEVAWLIRKVDCDGCPRSAWRTCPDLSCGVVTGWFPHPLQGNPHFLLSSMSKGTPSA